MKSGAIILFLSALLARAAVPGEGRLHEIDLPTVLRLAEARNLDIQIARAIKQKSRLDVFSV